MQRRQESYPDLPSAVKALQQDGSKIEEGGAPGKTTATPTPSTSHPHSATSVVCQALTTALVALLYMVASGVAILTNKHVLVRGRGCSSELGVLHVRCSVQIHAVQCSPGSVPPLSAMIFWQCYEGRSLEAGLWG
jgi:hypothetical protein